MEGISAVYGSDGSFRLLALPSFDFIRGKGDWNDRKFTVFMSANKERILGRNRNSGCKAYEKYCILGKRNRDENWNLRERL